MATTSYTTLARLAQARPGYLGPPDQSKPPGYLGPPAQTKPPGYIGPAVQPTTSYGPTSVSTSTGNLGQALMPRSPAPIGPPAQSKPPGYLGPPDQVGRPVDPIGPPVLSVAPQGPKFLIPGADPRTQAQAWARGYLGRDLSPEDIAALSPIFQSQGIQGVHDAILSSPEYRSRQDTVQRQRYW
jgi:hypothetical protein